MCIAILKPADKDITKNILRRCFDANPDGCGFAYINTDTMGKRTIRVHKYMEFEHFYTKYERCTRIQADSPFLIHFRIKTHGLKDIHNCHPFMIDKDNVFIHNGIIQGVGYEQAKSDTRLFNEKVLQQLPVDFQNMPAIKLLIEDFIGGSKLVFLNIDGSHVIMNESKGIWDGGIWWSNSAYKETRVFSGGAYWTGEDYKYNGREKPAVPAPVPAVPATRVMPDLTEKKKCGVVVPFPKSKRVGDSFYHLYSTVECDGCSQSLYLTSMFQFKSQGDVYYNLCKRCAKQEIRSGFVQMCDKISNQAYIAAMNAEFDREQTMSDVADMEDYMNSGAFVM